MFTGRICCRCVFIAVFFFTCFHSVLRAENAVVLRSRGVGMFSMVFDVLSLMQSYENSLFDYVEVDFGTTGCYYDRRYGSNWWRYYFHPIVYGHKTGKTREIYGGEFGVDPWEIDLRTSRQEAHRLLSKYVKVLPHIEEKINRFVKKEFRGYVIGIHYRGTDKITEAPRVPYEVVDAKLKETIKQLGGQPYTLFIATDEGNFMQYMLTRYPDKICFLHQAQYSFDGQPLHLSSSQKYKHGEDAVLDCLLLSKTNLLIRTSSNLSKCSTYFNPNLKVIELNQRFTNR